MYLAERVRLYFLLFVCAGITALGLACDGSSNASANQQASSTATPWPSPARGSELETYEELLAKELDIDVDELREASNRASDRYFDQLTSNGLLGSREADFLRRLLPGDLAAGLLSLVDFQSLRDAFLEHAAAVMGIDQATLDNELRQGKTLREIAEDHDVTKERLSEDLKAEIDDLLAEFERMGIITSDQADNLEETLDRFVERLNDLSPTATPSP